jgi:hypothetical protein
MKIEIKYPKEIIFFSDKLKYLDSLICEENVVKMTKQILDLCIDEIGVKFDSDKQLISTVQRVNITYDNMCKDSKWLKEGGFKRFCLNNSALNKDGVMTQIFDMI